jgi:hypothetical protein
MFWHLTARTLLGTKPFASPDVAWWFWLRMRRTFPEAAAACLMPNHPHVLVEGERDDLRERLCGLMSGLARHLQLPKLWEPAPTPTPIRTAEHLERQVKYVVLNPCRARITDDPLAWPWTTYRGLLGAELDPWVHAGDLAPVVHRPVDGFENALHAYVGNDASVSKSARRFPQPAPQGVAATPMTDIARAATSVTPWGSRQLRRDVAVALARHQGWRQSGVIGAALGCSARSIDRARPVRTGALHAAALALGTPALRLSDSFLPPPAKKRQRHLASLSQQSDIRAT